MQRITVEELDIFFDQQLLHRFIWRKRQHGLLFFQPVVARQAVDGLVLTAFGYLASLECDYFRISLIGKNTSATAQNVTGLKIGDIFF